MVIHDVYMGIWDYPNKVFERVTFETGSEDEKLLIKAMTKWGFTPEFMRIKIIETDVEELKQYVGL